MEARAVGRAQRLKGVLRLRHPPMAMTRWGISFLDRSEALSTLRNAGSGVRAWTPPPQPVWRPALPVTEARSGVRAWTPPPQPVWRPALLVTDAGSGVRAWTPPPQPVWRPALLVTDAGSGVRAKTPPLQPVWRPALRRAALLVIGPRSRAATRLWRSGPGSGPRHCSRRWSCLW